MTSKQVMAELKSLGDERLRKINSKNGAGEDQFGVKLGDVRNIAKKIKSDHALALELWKTGNLEARMLATLIIKPKELSAKELESMVKDVDYGWLADWLNSYVVKLHPDKEKLREKWMKEKHPTLARAGWSLTTERIAKSPDGLDVKALLDRIEKEMGKAPELAKWNMNFCLIEIGVSQPKLRSRATKIGEKVGAYRDYPVSKGCTSPFAPIAIEEMSKRKK